MGKDGVGHINIYSKGETEVGRILSNFAHTPIHIPAGEFASLEGYWYWMLAPNDGSREALRKMYGYKAKMVGRILCINDWPDDSKLEFEYKFKVAMRAKVEQNTEVKQLLIESTLPFEHYYVSGKGTIIRPHNSCQWMLNEWTRLRVVFQGQAQT